jgi:nitrite reductase (NADH) large subunit
VIADGRLTGAVLFGDTADGLWYLDLIRSGASIESMRDDLAFGRAFAERAQTNVCALPAEEIAPLTLEAA